MVQVSGHSTLFLGDPTSVARQRKPISAERITDSREEHIGDSLSKKSQEDASGAVTAD